MEPVMIKLQNLAPPSRKIENQVSAKPSSMGERSESGGMGNRKKFSTTRMNTEENWKILYKITENPT